MGSVELQSVTVVRDGHAVLEDLQLSVRAGERFALLGPSGSGKSTLLRVIAGVQPIDRGQVLLDGRDVAGRGPRERDVAMVDQEASLQPHLDVRRNIGFPLSLRRTDRGELDRRVDAEARAFSLRPLLGRRPAQLSAGQRHDVALARSLVRRVGLLLYDEPFARTDAPRQAHLLRELIALQEGYGVTLIAATNDQRLGLGLAHRCAVLHGGHLVQVGDTEELFDRPCNTFVAGFVGTPPTNLLPGRVERARSGVRVVAGPFRMTSFAPAVSDLVGQECIVGIRPTDLHRARTDDGIVIEEAVQHVADLGPAVEVGVGGAAAEVIARIGRPAPRVGELVTLGVEPARVHLFDGDGSAVSHGI